MSKLNIDLLMNPATSLIKGLWFQKKDCPEGQGLTVFRQVMFSLGKADLQHKDIAEDVGLTVGYDSDSFSDSGYQAGICTLAEKNVWGFVMLPIIFENNVLSSSTNLQSDHDRGGYVLDVSDKHVGLIAEGGLVGLDQNGVENIGEQTARRFWREKIYAFMYSREDAFGMVWGIKTVAGLTGPVPYVLVNEFLSDLARFVAPHFTILKFMPVPNSSSGMLKERINIKDEEAREPSCLRWPEDLMLLNQLTGQASQLDKPSV
ncbi:MAG: hypothetical protein KJ732_02360 [Candidatus Margulisbacteria bacterium]|nr:hypothetical protein [Candidatus Margulisiibacteriota bacterium]